MILFIRRVILLILLALVLYGLAKAGFWVHRQINEIRVLKAVVERLSAESRVAEAIVTESRYDEESGRIETTIKFVEYDSAGSALAPKYLKFQGNLIQFQALVVRFEDQFVRYGDELRGKSAYLFLRAFALDDDGAQVYPLTQVNEIPKGYKIPGLKSKFEAELWEKFWAHALDSNEREAAGVKNAQVEAPGTVFQPGFLYTLRIEHDGGIVIYAEPIPDILLKELYRSSSAQAPETPAEDTGSHLPV